MYEITPLRVLGVLAFYAAIFVIIRLSRERIEPFERKTFVAIGLVWAGPVFIANYLLYKAGAMSYLPWVNNFMHTFLWIGIDLSWLYLAIRGRHSLLTQVIVFTTFSLIVKYAEQIVFGTWDHDNFFGIEGNGSYVLGWSLADGTYPILTLYGLRLVGRYISGLIVI